MGKVDKALELAKEAFDKSKKIASSLEKMTNATVDGGINLAASTTKAVVNHSGNFIVHSITVLIYFGILILFYEQIFGFLNNYFFKSVLTLVDSLFSYMFFPELFLYVSTFMLFVMLLMAMLNVQEESYGFVKTIFKIIGGLFVLSLFVGFLMNSEQSPFVNNSASEVLEQRSFSFMERVSCFVKDYSSCKEELENTRDVSSTSLASYNIVLQKVESYNYKDLKDYMIDGLKIQYDIESTGDLYLKEFKCYYDKISQETNFYTEDLNYYEVTQADVELFTYRCRGFSKKMFHNKTRDSKITIYPVLIFDLKSIISQELPVLNANKLSPDEINAELDSFVNEYTEFSDTGSKLMISSLTFEKQMPVILGDGKVTDRSFTITIGKKFSSFGKFMTGEVLGVVIPSALTSVKEVSKYIEKIQLDSEVHAIDFDVFDNEQFVQSMFQNKIVQSIEIDYLSTFYNSRSFEIKVNVPVGNIDEDGNPIADTPGEFPEDYEDPNREVSGVGPGIVG